MFYVYIIYSKLIDQYYIGSTANLIDRLYRHRNSGSKSTKKVKDWELLYSKEFESRKLAVQAEMKIKAMKSREYISQLIQSKPK
ncbi:MAG: GIY-YIG nuclease family protein [Bacteroidia bacterium]